MLVIANKKTNAKILMVLQWMFNITYLIRFQKNNIEALINYVKEINIIILLI